MIELFQPLPAIAFSRNEIWFIVKSDNYRAAAPVLSVNRLTFTGVISPDDTITFSWATGETTMTAKADPDGSGMQFPAGDGGNAYVSGLVDFFRGNYFIDRDFDVTADTAGADPALVFTARKASPNFDLNAFAAGNLEITVTTHGVAGTPVQNFAHHYQVLIRNPEGTDDLVADDSNTELDIPLTGKTSVDIGEHVLNSFLSPDYPELTAMYARCVNSIRSYYCKYGQYYGANPTIKRLYRTPVTFVALGGLSVNASRSRDIITELCPDAGNPAQNRFLRQGSKNKMVRTAQPEWLTFINLTDTAVIVSLEVVIYNLDESHHLFNAVDELEIPAYAKYQFQTGFTQLNITGRQAVGKTPVYYTCRIKGPDGYLTDTYAYVIENKYREWPRCFVYLNSYGAYQTIATTGKQLASFDREKDDARLSGAQGAAAIAGDFLECNITIRNKFTISIGNAGSGRRNNDLFRDFALSTSIFIWNNGQLIPIVLNSSTIKAALDGENVYPPSFEYYHKYAEVTWTEDPAKVTDDAIADLLIDAGSPVPATDPTDPLPPVEYADGVITLPYGDPHVTVVAGKQRVSVPFWLTGKTGYTIAATQMGEGYMRLTDIYYNAPGGYFEIIIPGWRQQPGDEIKIWPFVLNPDSL